MIALDTNILARWLLADDAVQFAAAKRLLGGAHECTAPLTVLLELVWVLEAHKLARADVARGLRALLGLPHFKPREPQVLARCLGWYEQGLDFADALHLAQSDADDHFASFDAKLAQRAAKLGARPPVLRPA